MITLDVCRLCLSTEDLLWVYDKRIECESENEEFHQIVFHTSGVRILVQDLVTQKICKKCRDLINSVWRFRKNSIKTDNYLREKLEKYLRDGKLQIPNTDTILKYNQVVTKSHPRKKCRGVHPSVSEILQNCPGLKLPPQFRNLDLAPFVSMELFQVEQLFEEQNLNMHCTLNLNPKASDALPFQIQSYETIVGNSVAAITDPTNIPMVIVDDDDEPTQAIPNKSPSKDRRVIVEPTVTATEALPILESAQIVTEEVNVYVCDICAFVVDNPDTDKIKKHRRTHALRCKYCRKGYVGAKLLNHHTENRCHHRKALINNPVVLVKRVDKSSKWKKKYPNAFKGITRGPSALKSSSKPANKPVSDDKTKQKRPYHKRPKSSEPSTSKKSTSTTPRNSKESTADGMPCPKSKKNTSIICPRIGIEDNHLLDRLDPNATDIDVIRTLVRNTTGIKVSYDNTAQTNPEPVRSSQIRGNEVVLKNIKPDLNNQVLVLIKHGTLSAKYSQEEPVKVEKKPRMSWTDMKPIEVAVVEYVNLMGPRTTVNSKTPSSRYAQGRSTSKDMPLIDSSISSTSASDVIDLVEPETRPTTINYASQNGQVFPPNGQDNVTSSSPSPQTGAIRVKTIAELCN